MRERGATHTQKAAVAFGETVLFTIVKHIWPSAQIPAEIGQFVTTAVIFLESQLAINDFNRQLGIIVKKLKEIEKNQDDEPIPPNPETATANQIIEYKKKVLDDAFRPPQKK